MQLEFHVLKCIIFLGHFTLNSDDCFSLIQKMYLYSFVARQYRLQFIKFWLLHYKAAILVILSPCVYKCLFA